MTGQEFQQSNIVIDYRALKARKAWLGLFNKDLIQRTRMGSQTVSGFLNGATTLNLQTMGRLAAELGLRVIVKFELIDQQRE